MRKMFLRAVLLIVSACGANHSEAAERQERFSYEDFRCLATAIYREARGEPRRGKLFVAYALLGRASSKDYREFGGPTICGAFFHTIKGSNVLQFEPAKDPIPEKMPYSKEWHESLETAAEAMKSWLADTVPAEFVGTLWFLNPTLVSKRDADKRKKFPNERFKDGDCFFRTNLVPTETVGKHEFFRRPRTKDEQKLLKLIAPTRCLDMVASR